MPIKTATKELYRIFGLMNDKYFGGELTPPAITIQTKGKRPAYGWCSTVPFWDDKTEETDGLFEINMSAEYMGRDVIALCTTLLHEIIHYYNNVQGIQDCSRGSQYHNAKFRDACNQFGMMFNRDSPDKRLGWFDPVLKPETVEWIKKDVKPDPTAFRFYRKEMAQLKGAGKKKKSNNYKIVCPSCELIIRATKQGVKVICADCNQLMQEVDS